MRSSRSLALALSALALTSASLGAKVALTWAENRPLTVTMACAVVREDGGLGEIRLVPFTFTRGESGWDVPDRKAVGVNEVCVPREIDKW